MALNGSSLGSSTANDCLDHLEVRYRSVFDAAAVAVGSLAL